MLRQWELFQKCLHIIRNGSSIDVVQEELHFKDRIKYAWGQVVSTAKKVFLYVLVGVAIGAFIHNWIPENFIVAGTKWCHCTK